MERCSDVENVEGQFKVIGGYRGQIRTHCPMEVKLGWWSDIPMPKIVKVNSRSSGVTGSNPQRSVEVVEVFLTLDLVLSNRMTYDIQLWA